MIKLKEIYNELKLVPKPSKNHIYYEEVNDWIEWDDWEIEDKDGAFAEGSINGIGLTGKNYNALCVFTWEGGWEPIIDEISDIQEV